MAPRLYCPAGLAARASRRSVLAGLGVLLCVLAALALATDVRTALLVLVCGWAIWMAAMPVVVIAAARRSPG
jgi:hypothetical protein